LVSILDKSGFSNIRRRHQTAGLAGTTRPQKPGRSQPALISERDKIPFPIRNGGVMPQDINDPVIRANLKEGITWSVPLFEHLFHDAQRVPKPKAEGGARTPSAPHSTPRAPAYHLPEMEPTRSCSRSRSSAKQAIFSPPHQQNSRPAPPEKPASRSGKPRDLTLTYRAFPSPPNAFASMSIAQLAPRTKENAACPQCGCKNTTKKGKRRNRIRTLQIYSCSECLHRFTEDAGKNKMYPLHLILAAVSTFNIGYSTTDTQAQLQKRFHRSVPERTINSWIAGYKPFTTYARLRVTAKKLFAPNALRRPGQARRE
jgi:transposase-like protein